MRYIFPKVFRRLKKVMRIPIINVEYLKIGKNVVIEPDVEINCKRLILGDGVVIKSGTKINMTDIVIGDYTKINNNCLFSGTNWCRIGHNCWFGHYTIVDSIGTTRIGNGVGVGAHSQLWTHAYFGDILEGCQFASDSPLIVEDDVWFVGHCIVSPIYAQAQSMAMVGSVITKNMEGNHIYAGVPAKDMTKCFGTQFKEVDMDEKYLQMEEYLNEFLTHYNPGKNRIRIVKELNTNQTHLSQFSLSERTYIKNLYPEEVQFMRFLLPTKAKFLPYSKTDWVASYLQQTSQ